jgi:hypothetical protein
VSEEAVIERPTRFNWRLLFAVLIPGPIAGMFAALIFSVTVFAEIQLYNPHMREGEMTYYLGLRGVLFMGALTGGIWGSLPMLLVGLPVHAWPVRRTRRQIWAYAAAACLAGLQVGGFMGMQLLASAGPDPAGIFGWCVITGACAGVIAGLVFWLIRRPDRDVISPPPRP